MGIGIEIGMGGRTRLLALALAAAVCLFCGGQALADGQGPAAEKRSARVQAVQAVLLLADAEPAPLERLRAMEITDLPEDSPACDAARYVLSREILQGKADGLFEPDSPVSRAVLAAVLFRLSGEEAPEPRPLLAGVSWDAWYADAAAWAVDGGILGGGEAFEPQALVTRGQLALAMYRYAVPRGYPAELAEPLEAYRDGGAVSGEEAEALAWALGNGLFRSVIADSLLPNIAVSRLQLAQALTALERGRDPLAAEIFAELPARTIVSAAQANHDQIQEAVNRAAERYGATGLQVAVVEDGVVTDTFAWGWATMGEAPMTAGHKLRVASISKVAVGLGAMLLREEGTVDLDQSIGEYWGCTVRNASCPDKAVSIRTLLNHTSSLLEPGDNISKSYESVRARLASGEAFGRSEPGEIASWSYNNYGFAVLGMTLELAAEDRLDSILRNRLYTAMDIDASFESGDIQETELLATLYKDGSVSRSRYALLSMHAGTPGSTGNYFAGGLTVSAADLAKVAALLAADGKYEGVRLLSEESVALMESHGDQTVSNGFYQALPLRLRYGVYGRDRLYYHTGSAYGMYNCFSYDPDTGDGVIVLSVGASGVKDENGIYSVCAGLMDLIYPLLK